MEIIAEFGCNWDRYVNVIKMLDRCQELGIKYAKMQLWKREQVPKEVEHMYIGKGMAGVYFKEANDRRVEMFFTPFYPEAVDICERIGVNYYKIRSHDYFNLKLYNKIYKTSKKFFLSSNINPICNAINLFCQAHYPARPHEYLEIPIGYQGVSDHTSDLEVYEYWRDDLDWFEMHVCLDDTAYERKWSKTFDEIAEVIA